MKGLKRMRHKNTILIDCLIEGAGVFFVIVLVAVCVVFSLCKSVRKRLHDVLFWRFCHWVVSIKM